MNIATQLRNLETQVDAAIAAIEARHAPRDHAEGVEVYYTSAFDDLHDALSAIRKARRAIETAHK